VVTHALQLFSVTVVVFAGVLQGEGARRPAHDAGYRTGQGTRALAGRLDHADQLLPGRGLDPRVRVGVRQALDTDGAAALRGVTGVSWETTIRPS
jgi:hypothetical protein